MTRTAFVPGRSLAPAKRVPGAPLPTARSVDLERYMGRWYVIACIPTILERGMTDAVETYSLECDGSISTTFQYRRADPRARFRTWRMRGFVEDRQSEAVWSMRFLGLVQAEYRIMDVSPDYSRAVIGRSKRDYAWILSRTPSMSPRDLFASVRLLREAGYDTTGLTIVKHRRGAPLAGGPLAPLAGQPITAPAAE